MLGKSQQLSAGLDAEEARPRKAKDPKAQAQEAPKKDAADSPSRGLRAAAAFASDRAAPDLEPSLWDQLLQEAEEAQQGVQQGAQGAQGAQAPKVTAAKRRSSPRRKGQQPQQSAQSQRTSRPQSEVDATLPRRRSAVERRPVCHRSASRETSRNSVQKASPRSEKAKGTGVRPKTDSQMETLQGADGEPTKAQLQDTTPEQTDTPKVCWASSESPVISEQGGERHAGRIAASVPGPKNDSGLLRPRGAAATDAEKKQPPPAAIEEVALSDSPLHRSICEMPSLRPKPSVQSQRDGGGSAGTFRFPREAGSCNLGDDELDFATAAPVAFFQELAAFDRAAPMIKPASLLARQTDTR